MNLGTAVVIQQRNSSPWDTIEINMPLDIAKELFKKVLVEIEEQENALAEEEMMK